MTEILPQEILSQPDSTEKLSAGPSELSDAKLYLLRAEWNLHPEWHDKNRKSIEKIKGGAGFLQRLRTFCKSIGNQDLLDELIPGVKENWSKDTEGTLREIWNAHREWHGLNRNAIAKVGGGSGFAQRIRAFSKRINNEALLDEFFPRIIASNLGDTEQSLREIWNAHSEWHNHNRGSIQSVEEGSRFLSRIYDFSNSTNDSTLIDELFPKVRESHSEDTEQSLRKIWEEHSEWHNYNRYTIQSIKGGGGFLYRTYAFSKRINNEALLDEFFPKVAEAYSPDTEQSLREFWTEHPELHNHSRGSIRSVEGGSGFLQRLYRFSKRINNEALLDEFFPRVIASKIEDTEHSLREIWKAHREWQGLNRNTIAKLDGGPGFLQRLYALRKKTGNKTLLDEFFPVRRTHQFDFGSQSLINFDSGEERVVAILLNKFGLLDNPAEGVNVHVKTNRDKRNSLDFFVNGIMLEYHPTSISEVKSGMLLSEVAEHRLGHITKAALRGYPLYHIWKIEQLYDFVTDPEINQNESALNVTEEEFKQEIIRSYERARQFDLAGQAEKSEAQVLEAK